MVLPLIPIAAAAGGVGIGALLGGLFLGGSKKEVTQAPSEIHATKEHYSPVVTDARALTDQRSWTWISESPYSSVDSKKTATTKSTPDVSTYREQGNAPSAVSGITEGTDLTKLALVGAAGLVVYGVVTKK